MDAWLIVTAIANAFSAIIASVAIYQTVQLHKRQELLQRRQVLLPFWDRLQALNEINPKNPVWIDVIKAVNTLELVAVAWEGQLIDENIIRRMYSQLYIDVFESILECKDPPQNISKDGKQMLYASPATIQLYEVLIKEYVGRNKLSPIS